MNSSPHHYQVFQKGEGTTLKWCVVCKIQKARTTRNPTNLIYIGNMGTPTLNWSTLIRQFDVTQFLSLHAFLLPKKKSWKACLEYDKFMRALWLCHLCLPRCTCSPRGCPRHHSHGALSTLQDETLQIRPLEYVVWTSSSVIAACQGFSSSVWMNVQKYYSIPSWVEIANNCSTNVVILK
jgi:hypothetical protein